MCSAVIFWRCVFWHHHFSASITCEAIPSRSQFAITQGKLSLLPDALDAAPRLVDLFVSGIATTVVANCCLAYVDVQVDSDQKETHTSRPNEDHNVRSQLIRTVPVLSWFDQFSFTRIRQGERRNETQLEVYSQVGYDWSIACLTSVVSLSFNLSPKSGQRG